MHICLHYLAQYIHWTKRLAFVLITAKNFMHRNIEYLESASAYTEMKMRKYKTTLLKKSTIKN